MSSQKQRRAKGVALMPVETVFAEMIDISEEEANALKREFTNGGQGR